MFDVYLDQLSSIVFNQIDILFIWTLVQLCIYHIKPKSEVQSPKVKTKRTWADTEMGHSSSPSPKEIRCRNVGPFKLRLYPEPLHTKLAGLDLNCKFFIFVFLLTVKTKLNSLLSPPDVS